MSSPGSVRPSAGESKLSIHVCMIQGWTGAVPRLWEVSARVPDRSFPSPNCRLLVLYRPQADMPRPMKPTEGFDVMAVTICSFCFPQPNHIDRIVAYLLLSMGGRGSGAASKGPHKRTAMLAVRKPGQKGVSGETAS